jgi:hypothetical protein
MKSRMTAAFNVSKSVFELLDWCKYYSRSEFYVEGWTEVHKGHGLVQSFSNCGMCTTSGTPATFQWYTGIAKKIEG